jgi:hypothetical protein
MKKITLRIVFMISFVFGFSQTTITIGTGTVASGTNDNGNPIYRSTATSTFSFSQSVQLLKSSDLSSVGVTAGATITKIAYFKTTAFTMGAGRTADLKIYLKNSVSTSLVTNQNMITWTTGATLGYSNPAVSSSEIPAAAGWVEFILSTPFNYTGGAIEVAFDWAGTGAGSGLTTGAFQWQYTTATTAQAVGTSSSSAITGNLTSQQSRLYNAQLTFTNSPCTGTPAPGNTLASNLTPCPGASVTFSLQNSTIGSGVTYQWYNNAGIIAAGTNPTYTASINASDSYYCNVTCSSSTTASAAVSVAPTAPLSSFSENFDSNPSTGTTSPMPTCWDRTGTTGSTYVTTGGATPGSAPNRLYMFSSSTTPTVAYAITPVISNIAANTHRLKFKAYSTTAGRTLDVGYLATVGDPNTFTLIQTVTLANTTAATAQEFYVTPNNPMAGTTNLCFKLANVTTGTSTIYIDDVVWQVTPTAAPICATPTATPNPNCGNYASTISWAAVSGADGYLISYGTNTNGNDIANNQALGDVLSFSFTGTAATTYYYKITPFNTLGNAQGCAVLSFTTSANNCYCLPSSTSNASYIDNFTTSGGSTNISNLASGFTTGGYLDASSQAVQSFATGNFSFNATIVGGTVGFAMWIDWDNSTSFEASEKVFNTTAYGNGPFTGTITIPAGTAVGNYRMRIVTDFGASNPTLTCDLRPRAEYEDYTVTVTAPPACLAPNNLTATSITANGASLGWTELNSAPNWTIEYGVSGFTQGTGTVVSNVANPYSLTGLLPNTTYQYYVRANCTSGPSSYSTAFTFKTLCAAVTIFNEDFESYPTGTTLPLPDCWSRTGTTGSSYLTTGSVAPNSPTKRLYMFSSGTTPTVAFANMPVVSNIAANTHRLRFRGYASVLGRTIDVGYLATPEDPNTFVLIETITFNSTTSATANQYFVTPNNVMSGTTNLSFRNANTTSGQSSTIYIDDVSWEVAPTSVPTCSATVTATPDASCGNFNNVINWSAVSGVDGYLLSIGTTVGGTEILNNANQGTSLTYSFAGNVATTYYYKVTPFNTFGNATGCVEQSFTTVATGCYCIPSSTSALTYINNFSTTGGSANISNLASGYSPNGYSVYTAQAVQGFATSSFNFTGEIVGGTVGFAIWVDWNKNFTFEASEKVFNTTGYGNGPFTGAITIPIGTTLGDYRMRVTTDYLQTNPNLPCDTRTRAEFEDYTVTVVAQPSCVPPASLVVSGLTPTAATISWTDVNSIGNFEYVNNNTMADPTIAGTATTATTINLTALTPSTVYYFHVRTICSGSVSDWSTISYTTPAVPPANDECINATVVLINAATCDGTNNNGTNVAATDSGVPNPACFVYGLNDVWFSVTVPANVATIDVSTDFLGGTLVDTEIALYSGTCSALTLVACDQDGGTTVLSNGFSWNSLITNAAVTGGNTYYVRVSGYSASDVGTFCLKVSSNTLASDSFDNASFNFYPNPVKDVLNLSYSETIQNVQVFNLIGQQVRLQNINSTSGSVNLENLPSGAYLVKVTTENGEKTIKVIKE